MHFHLLHPYCHIYTHIVSCYLSVGEHTLLSADILTYESRKITRVTITLEAIVTEYTVTVCWHLNGIHRVFLALTCPSEERTLKVASWFTWKPHAYQPAVFAPVTSCLI